MMDEEQQSANVVCLFVCPPGLYNAPERQRGQIKFCGRRSDMWSLGCMILELCIGKMLPPDFGFLDDKDDAQIIDLVKKTSLHPDRIGDEWIAEVLRGTLHP